MYQFSSGRAHQVLNIAPANGVRSRDSATPAPVCQIKH